jgi:rhodanese-related sulfurtransferase
VPEWYGANTLCRMATDTSMNTGASGDSESAADADASQEISLAPERVVEMLEEGGVQLIDVRESSEWDAGHVRGARHVEFVQVSAHADTVDKDQPVVFQCRGGSRSGMVAAAFRESGWDAYNMQGGLRAWEEHALPLEPEDGHIEGA